MSFKLVKKLFSINTEPEEYLAIFDCNVLVDGEIDWKLEYDKVLKESKAIAKSKRAPEAKPHKNYSAPVNKNGQLQMYEPPLFKDTEDEDALELSDMNIENLIVRALTIDELEARSLKEIIPDVREQLPDGDQSDMVSMMVDHFEYALRDEYKFGQFRAVLDRSKQLLNSYRNFRYINQFILGLDNLGRYYRTSESADISLDIGGGEDRRDYITFSEIQEANEF